jgi:hypothetical protein
MAWAMGDRRCMEAGSHKGMSFLVVRTYITTDIFVVTCDNFESKVACKLDGDIGGSRSDRQLAGLSFE